MNLKNFVNQGIITFCSLMVIVCSCSNEIENIEVKSQSVTKTISVNASVEGSRTRADGCIYGTPWDCGDPTITWAVYTQDGDLVCHNTYTHTGGASTPIHFEVKIQNPAVSPILRLFVFFQKSNLYKLDLTKKQITYNDSIAPGVTLSGWDGTVGYLNAWGGPAEYMNLRTYSGTDVELASSNAAGWIKKAGTAYRNFGDFSAATDAYYFFDNLIDSEKMNITLTSPFFNVVIASDWRNDTVNGYSQFYNINWDNAFLLDDSNFVQRIIDATEYKAPYGYNFWNDDIVYKYWVSNSQVCSFVCGVGRKYNDGETPITESVRINNQRYYLHSRLNVFTSKRQNLNGKINFRKGYIGDNTKDVSLNGVPSKQGDQLIILNPSDSTLFSQTFQIYNSITQ